MIQAIVCALVPTSGAGMSISGPITPWSSVAKRRVTRSSSSEAQRARIDRHAALRAAERDVDEGALPGHPHRERPHLVEVGRRVEADAALGRSARHVVLHAVAGEDADRPVVHRHREVGGPFALGKAQHGAHVGSQREVIGSPIELAERGLEGAQRSDGQGSRRDSRRGDCSDHDRMLDGVRDGRHCRT